MDIIYNKKCNKYFNINLYDKYNVYFYSNNKLNFIILKHKNKENIPDELWVTYTICCVYDMNKNIILKGKDMIIIEKDIIDNSLIIDDKKIRNMQTSEQIMEE